MATLQSQRLRDTYKELLKLNASRTSPPAGGNGVSATAQTVEDGGGVASALALSTTQIAAGTDGSVGTPVISRSSDTNTGLFFAAADTLAITTGGVERTRIDSTGAVVIGNGDTAASPSAALIRGTNGTGTNIAGSNLTIRGSRGTGTAAGGAIIVETAAAGVTSGTTLNSATEALRVASTGELLVGTTTNTNSSRLVVNGTITETVSGVQHLVASQADIGTAPNQIPLNQNLGALAFQDFLFSPLPVGTGITAGTGTICRAHIATDGGMKMMRILIDLRGLNSGGTAGDVIGVNGTANPCFVARIPAGFTILGGRMTCFETPAGGDTNIDLFQALENGAVEDQAVTTLSRTQMIVGGAQTRGTVTYVSGTAATSSNHIYLYLVGNGTANATYTAGRLLIEMFGV